MSREFTDFDGTVYEVVWAPDMKTSLTGDRLTKPSPLFDNPILPANKATIVGPHEEDSDVFVVKSPSKDRTRTSKRVYNKTGKHEKIKGFWDRGKAGLSTGPVEKVTHEEDNRE